MKKFNRAFESNLFVIVVCLVIGIIGYFGYQYRVDKLKTFKIVKGKVTMHTMSGGDTVGHPEIVCKVEIGGEIRLINYNTKDLKVEVGDCVEIKYSTEDTRITEVIYENGAVYCD